MQLQREAYRLGYQQGRTEMRAELQPEVPLDNVIDFTARLVPVSEHRGLTTDA